jgi:hypothetical protein
MENVRAFSSPQLNSSSSNNGPPGECGMEGNFICYKSFVFSLFENELANNCHLGNPWHVLGSKLS